MPLKPLLNSIKKKARPKKVRPLAFNKGSLFLNSKNVSFINIKNICNNLFKEIP